MSLPRQFLDKSKGKETFLLLLLLVNAHQAPHAALPCK